MSPESMDRLVSPLSSEQKKDIESNADSPRISAETQQILSGKSESELRHEAIKNEAERTERFKDHFEIITVFSLYFFWAIFMALSVIWVYHLISPPPWPRLPVEQIQTLQSIVTSVALGSVATGHFRKRMR